MEAVRALRMIVLGSAATLYSLNATADPCSNLLAGANSIGKGGPCFFLGGGAAIFEEEYSKETEATIFPTVSMVWNSLYWEDTEFGFYFLGDNSNNSYWSLAALVQFSERGYDPDDSSYLKGLPKTKEAFEGGLKLSLGGAWGEMELKFAHDLDDTHQGYSIDASYTIPFVFDELLFTPVVGLTYYDEKNSSYYYGVNNKFASLSRPTYKIEETYNLYAGYSILLSLSRDWAFFHSATVTQLDDDIKNSPIVVSDNIFVASAGFVYKF